MNPIAELSELRTSVEERSQTPTQGSHRRLSTATGPLHSSQHRFGISLFGMAVRANLREMASELVPNRQHPDLNLFDRDTRQELLAEIDLTVPCLRLVLRLAISVDD